ncbi:MAG: RNA-binding protein [Thermoprotei archaeon]|nr:MAG: RNA-binding protein [Thermoprotei archaeon]RLF24392.1 MAG: RNA-binding protein [Thermoprotei archaeon]
MPRSEEIIPKIKRQQIMSMLAKGERLDGRRLDEYRPISIELGVVEKAEGSAMVRLGNTISIAGVKVELGKPYPDTPDEGAFIVNAEFLPLASPTFEPGPPDESAIEVARVVDRGIRSSGAIDLKKLCILPGEKVWVVYIDVYVLNHDGNMMDASGLATIAALLIAKMPKVAVKEGKVTILDEWVPLPVVNRPVPVTMAKIGEKIVVDPSLDEELVMDCRITVTIDESDRICAVQKGIGGSLTVDDVKYASKLAVEKAKEIRKALPPLPSIEDVEWIVKEGQ